MTDTKHAPPPWKIVDNGETQKIRNNSGSIAMIMQTHLTRRRSHDETRATAHIIAAAPDMLEALEAAEESIVTFMGVYGYTMGSVYGDILGKIRAAIAKAKGKS